MKKTIKLGGSALLTGLLILTFSCTKEADQATKPLTAIQNVIKLNGVQQTIDSIVVKPRMVESKIAAVDLFYYLGHSMGSGAVSLLLAPSNTAYATGSKLDLSSGDLELYYLSDSGNAFDDNPIAYPSVNTNPAGTVVITKNDPSARKIEGTLSGCVLPLVEGSGNTTVTLDGSFVIAY